MAAQYYDNKRLIQNLWSCSNKSKDKFLQFWSSLSQAEASSVAKRALAGVFLLSLLQASNIKAEEAKKMWFQCSVDRECLPTSNNCGELSAVNARFLTDYHVFLEKSDNKCSQKPSSSGGGFRVKCDKQLCSASERRSTEDGSEQVTAYSRAQLRRPE